MLELSLGVVNGATACTPLAVACHKTKPLPHGNLISPMQKDTEDNL